MILGHDALTRIDSTAILNTSRKIAINYNFINS